MEKKLTKSQILKLKPEFKFGDHIMVDWFEITETDSTFTIKSGLINANGVTKSPYHYINFSYGKNARKDCINKFNEWWNSINKKKIKIGKLVKIDKKWFIDYISEIFGENSWHEYLPIYGFSTDSEIISDLKLVEKYNKSVIDLEGLEVNWEFKMIELIPNAILI